MTRCAYGLFNSTGNYNIALGGYGPGNVHSGEYKIGIGDSGVDVSAGSYNIDIGNYGNGSAGTSTGSGVMRVGTAGSQASAYMAGITGLSITGAAVLVSPSVNNKNG